MDKEDILRELEKALSTLRLVEEHLVSMNKSNAALHCSKEILYSPLTMRVKTSIMNLDMLQERIEGNTEYM